MARPFTDARPASFRGRRGGACCRRGSSFRFCIARGRCRWCARVRLPCRSLITKYMLDTGAHLRAGRVGGLLRLTEFAIAIGPAMNTALQAAFGELFLDLSAAIGAVGPHVRSRVARIKNIFELLTVVYARVAHHVTAHEFVPAIDADMVLVTEIRPARVLVLLAVLGGLGFPVFRRF